VGIGDIEVGVGDGRVCYVDGGEKLGIDIDHAISQK